MATVIRGKRRADGGFEFTGMCTGNSYTLIVDDYINGSSKKVDVVIDGHSHIQSGATAPLPLLWEQAAMKTRGLVKVHFERSVTEAIAPVAFGKAGKIQLYTTEKVADILVSEVTSAYLSSKLLEEEPYKSEMSEQDKGEKLFSAKPYFFTLVIIMPMDMDFAHIAGFPPENTRIYHEGQIDKLITFASSQSMTGTSYALAVPSGPVKIQVDGVYCYEREKGTAPENKGKLFDVSNERPNHVWVHQRYKQQHKATIEAVKKNPWQVIPMFHYEPRRWCKDNGTPLEVDNWANGPWDEPFKFIVTAKTAGIFIGFKMYPPLGYKPLDPRLPNLEKFYARCEAEEIPILTHCSPGGMSTHEAKFYYQLDKVDLKEQLNGPVRKLSYDLSTPLGYFFDNYVHPKNWRTVLDKYPKLKLCLAHFGGQEWDCDEGGYGLESDWVKEITTLCSCFENVYTDMSCYDLEKSGVKKNVQELLSEMNKNGCYQHLQDKVIFGVDWYLSLLTGAPEYREYVESFFDTMKECDKWQWYKSSLVNPAEFYGLNNQDLIKNMNKALEDLMANEEKLDSGYKRIIKIKEQVENIRKKVGNTQQKAYV
jgi:hypothetical protein